MPRYFFHLRCTTNTVADQSGANLRDPDEAWEAARARAEEPAHFLTCAAASAVEADAAAWLNKARAFGELPNPSQS